MTVEFVKFDEEYVVDLLAPLDQGINNYIAARVAHAKKLPAGTQFLDLSPDSADVRHVVNVTPEGTAEYRMYEKGRTVKTADVSDSSVPLVILKKLDGRRFMLGGLLFYTPGPSPRI
jgi:hypothetical protein